MRAADAAAGRVGRGPKRERKEEGDDNIKLEALAALVLTTGPDIACTGKYATLWRMHCCHLFSHVFLSICLP